MVKEANTAMQKNNTFYTLENHLRETFRLCFSKVILKGCDLIVLNVIIKSLRVSLKIKILHKTFSFDR